MCTVRLFLQKRNAGQLIKSAYISSTLVFHFLFLNFGKRLNFKHV